MSAGPIFRDIRRKNREVPEHEAREILARASHGVLATAGAGGWPYAVPVNHVVAGDSIYVHGAPEGHKLDNLASDERVCYCAVASAEVMPEKLSTRYESAIVFGRAAVVVDDAERLRALELLAGRFCGGLTAAAQEVIRSSGPRAAVVRIRIERITGKANRPPG
jgi:nitroimidazol reductase NimA-like FMN-containing flavoprotein (pyridoxamine 5'-phosphate oxidase superfamily)